MNLDAPPQKSSSQTILPTNRSRHVFPTVPSLNSFSVHDLAVGDARMYVPRHRLSPPRSRCSTRSCCRRRRIELISLKSLKRCERTRSRRPDCTLSHHSYVFGIALSRAQKTKKKARRAFRHEAVLLDTIRTRSEGFSHMLKLPRRGQHLQLVGSCSRGFPTITRSAQGKCAKQPLHRFVPSGFSDGHEVQRSFEHA